MPLETIFVDETQDFTQVFFFFFITLEPRVE